MSRTDPSRQQELRGRILQAAATLIATEGFHGMTMRNLAKAAGTSLANVYNYFASKEDILFALQKEAFESLITATGEALAGIADAADRLYGFIYHHVRYFADHPEVLRVLVYEAASLPDEQRRAVRGVKRRYFEIGRRIVQEVIAAGCGNGDGEGREIADRAELERVTYSLFGMLNWIYGWYRPGVHGSPRQLARTIHEIALCGMVADCPHRQLQDRMEAHVGAFDAPPPVGLGGLGGGAP